MSCANTSMRTVRPTPRPICTRCATSTSILTATHRLSTPTRSARCNGWLAARTRTRSAIRSCCRASWRTFRVTTSHATSALPSPMPSPARRPGAWSGPVRSPFGVHLVKLESHTPPQHRAVRRRARSCARGIRRAEATGSECRPAHQTPPTIQNRRRDCRRHRIMNSSRMNLSRWPGFSPTLLLLLLAFAGFAVLRTLTKSGLPISKSSSSRTASTH